MHRFTRLLIICLLVFVCGTTFAQTETLELGGEAIVSADKDQPVSALQDVIELLNSHSLGSFKLRVVETPGVNVTITTRSNVESYAELKLLLQKAGVDSVEVRPAPMQWIDFSSDQLETMQETTGAIVLVRADWCAACQSVEGQAFSDTRLLSLVHESGVPFMRADFTDSNDAENEAAQLAKRVGVKSVPAFVIYRPNAAEGEKPLVIDDALDSAAISKLLTDHFPPKTEEENEAAPDLNAR